MTDKPVSATGILMFRNCQRQYWYKINNYPKPDKQPIALVMGSMVHKILKEVWDKPEINHDILRQMLVMEFNIDKGLKTLQISDEERLQHYRQCLEMLKNWYGKMYFPSNPPLFREYEIVLPSLNFKGIIDYVSKDYEPYDYKTSKDFEFTEEYKFQLRCYALLIYRHFNKLPKKIGLYLLKHNTIISEITLQHILQTEKEIMCFQMEVGGKNNIKENFLKISDPKQMWRCYNCKGQCNYYEICKNDK